MKRYSILLILLAAFALCGCTVNLAKQYEEGNAIVVYPDNQGTVRWQFLGGEYNLDDNTADLGGGYRAAALKPGIYAVSMVAKRSEISRMGRGLKDLDKGSRSGAGARLAAPRLGRAEVRRAPIKEEREYERMDGKGNSRTFSRIVQISSQYRIELEIGGAAGGDYRQIAYFEVKAGELLLLPSLYGEITLNEDFCARPGQFLGNPDGFHPMHYPLSHNPEDFEHMKWYCPLTRLTITKVPPSLDEVKAKADPKKLGPELLMRIQPGDLHTGPWLEGADKVERIEGGLVRYIFEGP